MADDRFDRSPQTQVTAPAKGRPTLADAAKTGRLAQSYGPRSSDPARGPQIAQPQQIAGTPSTIGKARA